MEVSGAPEVVFERVKIQLKARLGAEVYSNWFGSLMLARLFQKRGQALRPDRLPETLDQQSLCRSHQRALEEGTMQTS